MSREQERVSKRVQELKPSGIRKFFELIIGRDDVISLGVGEPDFAVPWRIREEIIYALEKGITSYTSNFGLKELREAIAEYYRKFGVECSAESVLITTGVSEGVDIALRAILNEGEAVLVPEPCYVSYAPLSSLAGGEVVAIPTTPDFKLSYELIDEYAKETKPKAIVINYPNNPTGVSYSKKELEEIADAAIEHDMIVISDEIYAELSYTFKHISIASLNGMEERAIILNGFSKAFAMTGLRIGYAIAPADILEGMLKIHQYCMLCAPVTAQIGALEALRNGEDELEEMRAEYIRRRNFFVKRVGKVLDVKMPDGAFYAFPSIESTGLSSEEFAERLLFEKNVAVVPGNAFGECGEGYIRCAYAVSMEKLREAVDRIVEFVEEL
ncbi:aminotransferase class I/II-fold pyridoxal phosphate-dependent enzyme [Archaeoglobus veneficus]|uniref:Aminotransferase n=1 Tax=Archaeoglobus veneficus (strain DSM 11195 / SNP6) TaxID=693661 RepID=F2KPT2_ARCVS|nr:aminotransferase class I/II-fold pyridoxal phosphate-dependent enzyme [Archaeoglobus veneficus]AEA46439.1 Aspartate transaminase [Archaeoglobus veneficus SNP6]